MALHKNPPRSAFVPNFCAKPQVAVQRLSFYSFSYSSSKSSNYLASLIPSEESLGSLYPPFSLTSCFGLELLIHFLISKNHSI